MNNKYIISTLVVLSVLLGTTPAAALSFGGSADTQVTIDSSGSRDDRDENKDNRGRDHGEDDQSSDSRSSDDNRERSNRLASWMFHAGIMGEVTAIKGDTITVRASNNTVYTVDADNAKVRGNGGINSTASIERGDNVFVQGVINGTNVVATLIVDAKGQSVAEPQDDEKRSGIAGTVTAKSGSTLTVLGTNGTTYTVATADASVWKNRNESTSIGSVSVGDTVVVQGTINGSRVAASKVYAVSIPESTANGDIRGTVTAIDGNTITILASGGASYTVDTRDAAIRDRKDRDAGMDSIDVGDSILVQGDVDGSTIDAAVVSDARVNMGLFKRIGNFWKNLFGKKDVRIDAAANGSASANN